MTFKPFPVRAFALTAALLLLLSACGGGGGDSPPAPASVPAETLSVSLTPAQEVGTPIASGAIGTATLSLDRANGVLSGTVIVDGVAPTAAHVHSGAAGTNGGVLLNMTINATGATLAASTLTTAQLASLDAGELYVNVHSAANASGEIRGQIGREVYTASLTGSQETTPVATAATGTGRLVLNPVTRALSGEVSVSGLTATAAHIHVGAFGSNGGIAINLQDHGGHGHYEVPANTALTEAQVASLRAGELYFNVHTAANAGGEIRGQIGRRVLLATADAAQEVPSNGSTATGAGSIVYDPATRAVSGSLRLTGMTATAAHIHTGVAGANGGIAVNLAETAPGSGVWAVPADTRLTADQAKALLANGLYFNAHSAAVPSGEIRGQIIAQ